MQIQSHSSFLTADILNRRNTSVTKDINKVCAAFIHFSCAHVALLTHLNRAETALMLLVTPVCLLRRRVKVREGFTAGK